MTLCWFTDALRSFGIGNDEFYLFRTLSGFSFVYLGCVFSIKDIPFRISHFGCWLIISLGFVLIVSESVLLNLFLMSNMHERQLPFGSVIVAIGILFHCVKKSSSASSMSHLGERYSLGVFLLHPFILTIISELFRKVGVNASTPRLLIAFFGSLLIIYLLDKHFIWAYKKLNGTGVK